MPVEVANGVAESLSVPSGDLKSQNPKAAAKKSRETEKRRRRRKQKKNKQSNANGNDSDTAAEDADGEAHDSSKENSDPAKALELVEVEYVPEKAELDGVDEEFRKVFEKFNFIDNTVAEEIDKKDETAPDPALKKKADSDSEEEEQDTQQKDKGISNKKKKVLH